jgi:hypothetical protein
MLVPQLTARQSTSSRYLRDPLEIPWGVVGGHPGASLAVLIAHLAGCRNLADASRSGRAAVKSQPSRAGTSAIGILQSKWKRYVRRSVEVGFAES